MVWSLNNIFLPSSLCWMRRGNSMCVNSFPSRSGLRNPYKHRKDHEAVCYYKDFEKVIKHFQRGRYLHEDLSLVSVHSCSTSSRHRPAVILDFWKLSFLSTFFFFFATHWLSKHQVGINHDIILNSALVKNAHVSMVLFITFPLKKKRICFVFIQNYQWTDLCTYGTAGEKLTRYCSRCLSLSGVNSLDMGIISSLRTIMALKYKE